MYRVIKTSAFANVPAHVMGTLLETNEAVKAVASRYHGLAVETDNGLERITIQRHWRKTYYTHTMRLIGPSFLPNNRDMITLITYRDPEYKGW